MQNNRVSKVMSFSFQPDMYQKINNYCVERGCTRSWFINKAVNLYLNQCLEDLEDYKTAVVALTEFENSDKKTYSLDEVRKELGL